MFKKSLSIYCLILLCTTSIAYTKEQSQKQSVSSTKKTTQTHSAHNKITEQTKKKNISSQTAIEKQPANQDKEISNEEKVEKVEKVEMRPPYQTDVEVTGTYYLAKNHIIRDVYITTPINNKFYFKVFAAQTPVQGAMSVQYYNEIDGVATFNKHGVGVFTSKTGNCDLLFFFKPPILAIQQEKDCGMSPDFDIIAGGIYTQTENFNPITQKK